MDFNIIFFLSSEINLFEEYLTRKNLSFFFLDYETFIFLNELQTLPINSSPVKTPINATSLYSFISQADDTKFFTNLENVQTVYHYSIPTTKLFYPEPFIASASFMHSDL